MAEGLITLGVDLNGVTVTGHLPAGFDKSTMPRGEFVDVLTAINPENNTLNKIQETKTNSGFITVRAVYDGVAGDTIIALDENRSSTLVDFGIVNYINPDSKMYPYILREIHQKLYVLTEDMAKVEIEADGTTGYLKIKE